MLRKIIGDTTNIKEFIGYLDDTVFCLLFKI